MSLCAALVPLLLALADPSPWEALALGLEAGRFPSPQKASVGDSVVTVVRVDPARYELRLLSAKLLGLARGLEAPEWAERYGVQGVINASMFQADSLTSIGYMRDGERVNNRRWNKDNAVFAAGPTAPGLPEARILDRSCEDWEALSKQYRVLVQNIRMLDCEGRNTWAAATRKWSTASVGTDREGRVLLVHARSAWTTHDFVDVLRALPLGLTRLMYVEGGPEASLYVKVGKRVAVSEMGSFETGFFENDENHAYWPLPNVIAFAPR
jgi:uncharacterized protein YigE (DUF2233 family)